MKTAEQIAEEVANEVMVGMQDRDDIKRIASALREYGAAVRQRAAETHVRLHGKIGCDKGIAQALAKLKEGK